MMGEADHEPRSPEIIAATVSDAEDSLPVSGAWMLLYDDLLGGIIHSMNNTLTVLAVSLELASIDDERVDAATLRRELTHLEELIALMATLSSKSAREEALELRAVLDIALAIHALNPATRAVKCALEVAGVIPPVRVPRPALMRALLLMIDGAKRVDGAAAAPVPIELSGDADRVIVRARRSDVPSRDEAAFAAACGGKLTIQDGCAVFELPSLQRLRAKNGGKNPPREGAMPTRASAS